MQIINTLLFTRCLIFGQGTVCEEAIKIIYELINDEDDHEI